MKLFSLRWSCLVFLAASMIRGAGAGSTDAPISLQLDEAASFPFPPDILGAQEEVVELSYLSPEFWKTATADGLSLLRYPCGTTSDWFAWDAPERGYWPPGYSQKRKKMYPDAFIALCRENGITPLITVNTSSYGWPVDQKRINPMHGDSIQKGADYAARWVDDFNVQKKFGVKYWEIGNEVWVWLKSEEYPDYVRRYAATMRAVDPTIKIIACGDENDKRPFYPNWLNFPNDPKWTPRDVVKNYAFDWNQRLLQEAKGSFDYMTLHIYLDSDSMDPRQAALQNFASVVNCEALDRAVKQIHDAGAPVRIAVTEWMVNFGMDPVFKKHFTDELGDSRYAALTYDNSPAFDFGSALVAADFLGRLISSGMVDIGVAHTAANGLFRNWNHQTNQGVSPPVLMPAGLAVKFWHDFAGETVVPVKIGAGPFVVFRGIEVPLLSAYATRSANGMVSLILIDRSPTESLHLSLANIMPGATATEATEHTVSAASWGESMWPAMTQPNAYPFTAAQREVAPGALVDYVLKSNQLTCLQIRY